MKTYLRLSPYQVLELLMGKYCIDKLVHTEICVVEKRILVKVCEEDSQVVTGSRTQILTYYSSGALP